MNIRGSILALAAVAICASSGGTQAQTTLRVSTYAPYQHPLVSVALTNWAKDVEKESGGRIKINILQAALGQPQAHYDMAVEGVSDITLGITGYTPGRFVIAEVAGAPNIGKTSTSLSVALWKTYEKFPGTAEGIFSGKATWAFHDFAGTVFQFETSSQRH